eukprot:Nk52_evm5s314 gene=Nk52_evmTU5s314
MAGGGPPVYTQEVDQRLERVGHILLVLSGKGGVGKSTVATQLALGLRSKGCKVGLLDIDLCGPSVPRMLNLEEHSIHSCSEGWVPVIVDAKKCDSDNGKEDEEGFLSVMSIGFLLGNKDEAVVWRGPKKTAMIKQFLTDVYWTQKKKTKGEEEENEETNSENKSSNNNTTLPSSSSSTTPEYLDFLVIDTPPGTSDEHISVVENLRAIPASRKGVVMVTTPQGVAVQDVRKEISFCRKAKLPIHGVVENMSGYVCEHCAECTNIFSSGGGEQMAEEFDCAFLGRIPIDPRLAVALDNGKGILAGMEESSPVCQAIESIVEPLLGLRKKN